MTTTTRLMLAFACVGLFNLLSVDPAEAAYRQRYSSWRYAPSYGYYYSTYYYQPYVNYNGYQYHYCVYYVSQPRYVYYYNPTSGVYWGRYDLEEKGYSMLEEKDRKGSLKEIPDSAFPKAGKMPAIPESKDGESIVELSKKDLPKEGTQPEAEKEETDLPKEPKKE